MSTKLSQLLLLISIVLKCEGKPEEKSSSSIPIISSDIVETINAKILWQSENLVMIKSVEKPSSGALGKDENLRTEMNDMEEKLEGRFSDSANADISKTCRKLHAFLCLQDNCKWIRGRCDDLDQWNGAPFSMSFPTSFHEFIEMNHVMWDNPPAIGSPLIWLAFLGSIMSLGAFAILRSVFCVTMWCYRKVVFKEQAEQAHAGMQKFLGKKLRLALPNGQKILISGYEVDTTSDDSRITLILSKTSGSEFLASTILNIEEEARSAIAGNRYCSASAQESINPVNEQFLWDDCKSLLNSKMTDDDRDNFSTNYYLNDGFSCCSDALEHDNVVSGDQVEEASSSGVVNLSDDLTTVQAPPLPERKLITPGKMWKSAKHIVTTFAEVEPGVADVQESAF